MNITLIKAHKNSPITLITFIEILVNSKDVIYIRNTVIAKMMLLYTYPE